MSVQNPGAFQGLAGVFLFCFFIQKSGALYGVQVISVVWHETGDNNQRPTQNIRHMEFSIFYKELKLCGRLHTLVLPVSIPTHCIMSYSPPAAWGPAHNSLHHHMLPSALPQCSNHKSLLKYNSSHQSSPLWVDPKAQGQPSRLPSDLSDLNALSPHWALSTSWCSNSLRWLLAPGEASASSV